MKNSTSFPILFANEHCFNLLLLIKIFNILEKKKKNSIIIHINLGEEKHIKARRKLYGLETFFKKLITHITISH